MYKGCQSSTKIFYKLIMFKIIFIKIDWTNLRITNAEVSKISALCEGYFRRMNSLKVLIKYF